MKKISDKDFSKAVKDFKESFKGGLADDTLPDAFDLFALREGAEVELEHTDDIITAIEIAMDHLSEDGKYYQKLKLVEAEKYFKSIGASINDMKIKASEAKVLISAWEKLPKGWTPQSLKDYWDSLVGDVKHKRTKCIKKLKDSGMDSPEAFCQSLFDMFERA